MRLLTCGAIAGPVFIGTVLVQDYFRPGVRPREQPLSLLTLGELGWIQISAFIVTGLLYIAGAVGLRRALHPGPAGTWGPLLMATYGSGLTMAGIFLPDPSFGFPPGAPTGPPADTSWHATLHDIAAIVVFGCLIASTVVFARLFKSSLVVGAALLALFIASGQPAATSEALRAAVLLGWGWASWLHAGVRRRWSSEVRGSLLHPR